VRAAVAFSRFPVTSVGRVTRRFPERVKSWDTPCRRPGNRIEGTLLERKYSTRLGLEKRIERIEQRRGTKNASLRSRGLRSSSFGANFIIGVFTLIPGFPMDGGRVLRSVIWQREKDYFYLTHKASGVGRMIALFFIFFGLFSIFAGA
jgi:hypothetical protein